MWLHVATFFLSKFHLYIIASSKKFLACLLNILYCIISSCMALEIYNIMKSYILREQQFKLKHNVKSNKSTFSSWKNKAQVAADISGFPLLRVTWCIRGVMGFHDFRNARLSPPPPDEVSYVVWKHGCLWVLMRWGRFQCLHPDKKP